MTPKTILTTLASLLVAGQLAAADFHAVSCEGTYRHHLQGICADQNAIYWSFTTTLVKTDLDGKRLKSIPVANHHGDLCCHDGKLYVAVNLGKFNDPQGNADSWIYVYEYDDDFQFVKRRVIRSGRTHLGIQTAAFAHGRWWFGCYGDPKVLLVTDTDFNMKGRYEYDCSLGIVGLSGGRFLSAGGRCDKNGCTGKVALAKADENQGLVELKPVEASFQQESRSRAGNTSRGH